MWKSFMCQIFFFFFLNAIAMNACNFFPDKLILQLWFQLIRWSIATLITATALFSALIVDFNIAFITSNLRIMQRELWKWKMKAGCE